MASSFVFYKFKSQREPSRVAFDGTAISVWDLKKEIIAENRMGKGADFDFAIYNADTEEEYTNDYAMIPRSSSVLARRLPPTRPGHGNAQKYMMGQDESGQGGLRAGRGAAPDPRGGVGGSQTKNGYSKDMFTKRFDGQEDRPGGYSAPGMSSSSSQQGSVQLPAAAPNDEASAMAAMFAATNTQWQETQQQMANATPIHRAPLGGHARPPPQHNNSGGGGGGGGGGAPGGGPRPAFRDTPMAHKPPPPGYICYRCGQKGHWIQECPTNGDAAYDNRPRIKRTTGIPKSFLTEVSGPSIANPDEEVASVNKSGIMVTADGGFVVARPDNASWLAHRALTANLTAGDIQNLAPTDPDLTCPSCSKLLRDAVLTPCCSTSYCDECVSNALLDNDMLCPECETRVKSLEKLKPDEDRRERAKKYVDEMLESGKELAEQEKQEREAEEEREKAAQEKAAAAAEEAAKAADEVKKEEGPEFKKEENVAEEEEDEKELFPVKPEEILNPRQPRVGEDRPPASTDMTASTSTASTSTTPAPPAAASPIRTRVPSATPGPAIVNNGVPVGLTAAAQAQVHRQQQQQQQQMANGMGMQQQQQAMGIQGMQGGGGMPTPQMVQQQIFQLSAMLQNPSLPPPMRMALQGQLQQCQMMMMQFQRQMAMAAAAAQQGQHGGGGMGMGMGMNGGMVNGMGMNGMGMNGMGMNGMAAAPLRGPVGVPGAPKAPAAMQQAVAAGQKRAREESVGAGSGPSPKRS